MKTPLNIAVDSQIYQALKALAEERHQSLDLLVEEAISQYIADQSLDGSGWSQVFDKLVADDHFHPNSSSPNLKAAELIAKREELKRKKREDKAP